MPNQYRRIKALLIILLAIFFIITASYAFIYHAAKNAQQSATLSGSAALTAQANYYQRQSQTLAVSALTAQAQFTQVAVIPSPNNQLPIMDQLIEIDQLLNQSMRASIAYNTPKVMNLDDTVTIDLLLNPSETEESLKKQITQTGQPVFTATIEITSLMRAILLAEDKDAFNIQSIHASAEQPISGTETTKWEWYVTAKKVGAQELTLAIYRLVKYDDQEYWREVESYKANIDVQVTLTQQVKSLDWKWIAGAILIPLFVAFWNWVRNKTKSTGSEKVAPRLKKRKKQL